MMGRFKTLGAVLLVAFGIHLLYVASFALQVYYDKDLGVALARATTITVALTVVRLWQIRDRTKPLYEPWRCVEKKPERRVIVLLVVALIAVSGVAIHFVSQRPVNPFDKFDTAPDVLPGDFFDHCGPGYYKPC
ncbi:MAG: hypothetical protein WB760_14335 [Xanthobacteraceae bacterium]